MLIPMEPVFVTREGCGPCGQGARSRWGLAVPCVRREAGLSPYGWRAPALQKGAFAEPGALVPVKGLLGGKA